MAGIFLKYYRNYFRIRKGSDTLSVTAKDPAEEVRQNPVEIRLEKIISELGASVTNIKEFSQILLSSVARIMEISQGAFFVCEEKNGNRIIKFLSGYAYHHPETENLEFEFGQGLSGQVAMDGKMININSIPDGYVTILSGLGKASPGSMIIFPVMISDEVVAVIELASFHEFSEEDEDLIRKFSPYVAEKIKDLLNNKAT